jgi:hypothetical protein
MRMSCVGSKILLLTSISRENEKFEISFDSRGGLDPQHRVDVGLIGKFVEN